MYKEAVRLKLRFQTSVGSLSAENLWDLSIEQLDTLAVELDEAYATSGKKSFVVKRTQKDKITKLKLDIVVDILNTKLAEREEAQEKADNKAHNERILGLIADKEEEELKGKSTAALKKMLR